ncbi:hypothetical protein Hanom_Chr04g00329201 [Helianthus anomalus]
MFLICLSIFVFVWSFGEPQQRLIDETVLEPLLNKEGKAQLKKKPLKKKKTSDDEDRSYEPDESKRKKRKVVQTGVIPRNVRAKKAGGVPLKEKEGRKER